MTHERDNLSVLKKIIYLIISMLQNSYTTKPLTGYKITKSTLFKLKMEGIKTICKKTNNGFAIPEHCYKVGSAANGLAFRNGYVPKKIKCQPVLAHWLA